MAFRALRDGPEFPQLQKVFIPLIAKPAAAILSRSE
jgi:hypothetical protein